MSNFSKGLHPGTVWRKCDLQCHTPRDRGWQGSTNLPGGTPEAEAARRDWAECFVAACAAAKLTAVAVTDHHDHCMSRYVIEAASRAAHDIIVYPGMEITCSDNAQVLVLFDPALPPAQQATVLAKAGDIAVAADDDATTCLIQPARSTVMELFRHVSDDKNLKDACALLPHFSSDDAHKSLNATGHHWRFANLPCDGVYIERSFGSLDATTVEKIRGQIEDWGTRRRAVIATGDNRVQSWARLGTHDCWIKLGEPTIEAFRQALLADEARIAFTQPQTPSERIVEMTVKSSLTGPDPIRLSFNDGFTAFIGGRGSGKSAFLEYLRFALGRTAKDIDSGVTRERETELIEQTLRDDGFVRIVLEREGVRETWLRSLASRDTLLVTSGDGQETTLTSRDARERFRGRAFHQKGLSTTMSNPATAADQITGIAAAEELDQQRKVEQSIGNAQRGVATAFQGLAAYWQATYEKTQASVRVTDLKGRIAALSKKLEEEGVEPEQLAIIDDAPRYARAQNYVNSVATQINGASTALGSVTEQL